MRTIVFVCMCILIFPMFAVEAEHEQLARDFYRLNSPMERITDDLESQIVMINDYLSKALLGEESSSELISSKENIKSLFSNILEDAFDYQELEDISIPIIQAQYSATELKSIIAFLNSPEGQAYLGNSRLSSNYMTQAVQTYINTKSQDEGWISKLIMAIFDAYGLYGENPGSTNPTTAEDWAWENSAVSDTIDGYWWAESDSMDYGQYFDDWEDYWNTPVPVNITSNGKIFESLADVQYITKKLLPSFKQIYTQLDKYIENYGGYPNEVNWKKIKKVKGFDIEYDHDSSFLRATSNAKYHTQGIEVIYYLSDNSLWIGIPQK